MFLFLVGLMAGNATAQQFTGTNAPGASRTHTFNVRAGTTNLAFIVRGTATAYSHLLIRKGVAPTDAIYDFISPLNGQTNSIYLDRPEAVVTNWYVTVRTPASSQTHAYTVNVQTNRAGVKGAAKPASKALTSSSTITITNGEKQYFRFEMPTNYAWRVRINGTNVVPDLYIQRPGLPTESTYLRRSLNESNDVTNFNDFETAAGSYYVGAFSPAAAPARVRYTLETMSINVVPLAWDPGLTHTGTEVYTNLSGVPGDYYFKITTTNSSVGAWRSALNVLAGEAQLYLKKGVLPAVTNWDYRSERVGSDGFVLGSSEFAPSETWYLLVQATAGAQWTLCSGTPFVTDFGPLTTTSPPAGANTPIGPEGIRFFRTTMPANLLAWELGLNGAALPIILRKTGVPLPTSNEYSNATQILVVPPYLVGGVQYFVGVMGSPGTVLNIHSRQHTVTDLGFNSSTSGAVNGFGFVTYRVQVPPQQIAWQINASGSSGDPNVAVRRSFVPNERYNDAFSDLPSPIIDSVTLVPPGLSDGTFYVTVYGGTSFQYTVGNGTPTITDIPYLGSIVNDEPARAGWKYYRVTSIEQQLGSLGWELFLTNAPPGVRIALRKNAAPSIWRQRNPTLTQTNVYEFISVGDFLQRPAHQADIWYIGVYSPSNALGNYTLYTRELFAEVLAGDNQSRSRSGVLGERWEFFRVTVPADAMGWDVRVTGVTEGSPRVVVRREGFPASFATAGFSPRTATSWPSGAQWAPDVDWTKRKWSPNGGTDEAGRVLAMGMGQPLEAATYYIGVLSSNVASYTVRSRFIGSSYSIPLVDVDWLDGDVTVELDPREAAYYRIVTPSGIRSWKVEMDAEQGEGMLLVSTNRMPHIESEKRMQKPGKEHFVMLPPYNGFLAVQTNFVAVIGEGLAPTATDRIGQGRARLRLRSMGPMPETYIGNIGDGINYTDTAEGGESKAYYLFGDPDYLGFTITMENRVGNPAMVGGFGIDLFDPGHDYGLPNDPYGNIGGNEDAIASNYGIIYGGVDPVHVIMVKGRQSGSLFPDTSYTLHVSDITQQVQPLAFDGGLFHGQNEDSLGRYFYVDVPPNAKGWDLRIQNVTSGRPILLVRRDALAITPYNSAPTYGFSPDPFRATVWPSFARWGAGKDWTERALSPSNENEEFRILAMGMGRPLVPGRYYVCVTTLGFEPLTYDLISRGIGDGFVQPTVALVGNTSSANNILPREAHYYKVVVPTNTAAWKLKLSTVGNGEALMIALRDTVPNVGAHATWSVTNNGGHKMQKPGNEHLTILPTSGLNHLTPGDYYVAVVGEGRSPLDQSHIGTSTTDYVLESMPAPIRNLGTVSANEIVDSDALEGGEVQLYQFLVPSNTVTLQVSLEDRTGNPVMALRHGVRFADPGAAAPNIAVEYYGNDSGEPNGNDVNPTFLNIPNPTNGIYSLAVKARAGANSVYSNATYTLKVRGSGIAQIPFNGGTARIQNQPSSTWNFFQVDVPQGAAGWDLRLTNVTSGLPKMVIRRDFLPNVFQTVPWSSPYQATNWARSNQWAIAMDWTRRSFNFNGTVDESGRVFGAGMGRPLEPGTYFVGVINSSGTAPMSYTLVSRGIGEGLALPVHELAFQGGSMTFTNIEPREPTYFKVSVPSNSPNWKVKHFAISGDSMLVALKGAVPSIDSIQMSQPVSIGKGMQRAGSEHFVLLPPVGQTNIAAGDYYLAVVSEGENPSAVNRIGTGLSSFTITSLGPIPTHDFGTLTPVASLHPDVLEGGESKAYQFNVRTGAVGVKIRLEQRVGNPVIAFTTTNRLPDPGGAFNSFAADYYGNEGGHSVSEVNISSITHANPIPGLFQFMVKARLEGLQYPVSSYTVRVQELELEELNFDALLNTNGLNHVATGALEDNERAYYRVVVPATLAGEPVIGWKLHLAQSSGTAYLRVRKDSMPSDTVFGMMPFNAASSIIAPPYLTNGTWYVEVKGSNSTTYTLTSSALRLERAPWVMPLPGQGSQTPGVGAPFFGDSGVDTNGSPLPGDQSLFVEQGAFHYYAIHVPATNLGLVRVQLEGISGNPDLYARTNFVPTMSHGPSGLAAPLWDRSMLQTNTEYANWVPLNGRQESLLPAGNWYFAVRAAGNANARYRLRVSTGNIVDLIPNGQLLGNQILAGGDWRYYRIQTPTAVPFSLAVTFNQIAGDVVLHLRDVIPPGTGVSGTDYKDWLTDQRNSGTTYPVCDPPGTYTFSSPAVPPNASFYLGFRAVNDATFSVSALIDSSSAIEPQDLPFYGGYVTNTLPRYGSALYRINVPPDGARWRHSSVHTTNIALFIEGLTIPQMNSSADWRSTTSNSFYNVLLGNAPWFSNRTYYLLVTNYSTSSSAYSFTMDGRSMLTDDDDGDGMLDVWERQYFGNTGHSPLGDADGDGVSNLFEFQESTVPTNNASFNPRLTTTAVNGTLTRNPNQTNFTMGQSVTLTAIPNAGYTFSGWTGSTNGLTNPLTLVMNTNNNITALFKYPGDDFIVALPLVGASASATATNVGYTKETGEPAHAGNSGGRSIWWRWTAPMSGITTIRTLGSNFDTVLGVYTGPTVSNLTLIASDNHIDGFTNRSRVTFTAVNGTTYSIAVDGYNASTGTIQLNLGSTSIIRLANIARFPNGTVQFQLIGSPNTTYSLLATTNLQTWASLNPVTTAGDGTAVVTDNSATNALFRAYRARTP